MRLRYLRLISPGYHMAKGAYHSLSANTLEYAAPECRLELLASGYVSVAREGETLLIPPSQVHFAILEAQPEEPKSKTKKGGKTNV